LRRPHSEAHRVISAHGAHAWVSPLTGPDSSGPITHQVIPLKGRALKPVAGDLVLLSEPPESLTEILPRRNALVRAESHRKKIIAANLDLVVVLVSGEPLFSPELMVRLRAALASQGLADMIVLNKADLLKESQQARASLKGCLPWPCKPDVELTCVKDRSDTETGLASPGALVQAIRARGLKNPVIGLVGQSGMGKSSLLNWLIPDADAQTKAVSQALQTGRHTTTVSRAYQWQAVNGWLIDTPGFQTFGIQHLQVEDLLRVFPEWLELQRNHRCRFYNCRHDEEPGCVLTQALEAMEVEGGGFLADDHREQLLQRLTIWRRLIRDLG
jgi:ribosome biogenesis GTPase